jgi:hypothetical protein
LTGGASCTDAKERAAAPWARRERVERWEREEVEGAAALDIMMAD